MLFDGQLFGLASIVTQWDDTAVKDLSIPK